MVSLEEFSEEERINNKEAIIGALKTTLHGQIKEREEINKEIKKVKRLIKKMEGYCSV